jgi:hypothetical protein
LLCRQGSHRTCFRHHYASGGLPLKSRDRKSPGPRVSFRPLRPVRHTRKIARASAECRPDPFPTPKAQTCPHPTAFPEKACIACMNCTHRFSAHDAPLSQPPSHRLAPPLLDVQQRRHPPTPTDYYQP